MYFRDRSEAGELLASHVVKYRFEQVVVLALSLGGVLVGEQIARRLQCPLSLLLTARISAPGDPALVLGTIDQEGDFSYNDLIPMGQMEEYLQEMRTYLEEEKLHKLYDMANIVSQEGIVERDELRGKVVILATDGVKNGMSVEGALHFLKPIKVQKVVAAIPVGPGDVIERLMKKCDELEYLYIPDNFFHVGHYYENNQQPEPAEVMERLSRGRAKSF